LKIASSKSQQPASDAQSPIPDSDEVEQEYLAKMKASGSSPGSSSSSFHSIHSREKQQPVTRDQTPVKQPPLVQIEKQPVVEKTADSSENESDLEDYSTSKILKRIYQGNTPAATGANRDSASIDEITAPTGLDQYTLHPFVYLHPVIKPPLAEYTSITDCIDTSVIDRPVSPNILGILVSCLEREDFYRLFVIIIAYYH